MWMHRIKFASRLTVEKMGWFDAGILILAYLYLDKLTAPYTLLLSGICLLIQVTVFLHYYELWTIERLTLGRRMPMGEIPDCPRTMHYVVDYSHRSAFTELNNFQFRAGTKALLLTDNTIAVASFDGTSINDIKTVLRSQHNWFRLRRFSEHALDNALSGVITRHGVFMQC